MYLFDIDESLQLENYNLEVKVKLDDNDELPSFVTDKNGKKRKIIKPIPEWLKTVNGFANYKGGKLVLGVKDNDFSLVGFERDELDNIKNKFNNMINQHITPHPMYLIQEVKYKTRNKIRYILVIDIKESEYKPVILKYEQISTIYVRRDGFNSSATVEEIEQMSINSKKFKFDLLVTPFKYRKENFTDLQKLYLENTNAKQLSDKKLQSMGFYDENGFLTNGALLFKDDYEGEKTKVHCTCYSGFTRGDDKIVTSLKFSYNIPISIKKILEFIDLRENHGFIKNKGLGRVDLDSYPQRSLVEGIVNAIAHRDYLIDGTQIQVDMFKDRLEITSPGSFLKSDKLEKTYNLENIISKRRNELICNVLVACNLMEASGTGFEKIMEDYSNADDNHKPYVFSTPIQFTLVLPDLTYDNGIVDSDIPELIIPFKENIGERGEKILSYCYRQARSANDIAMYLNLSNSTYFRNNILKVLVDKGFLDKSGGAKNILYKTNRDMVSIA